MLMSTQPTLVIVEDENIVAMDLRIKLQALGFTVLGTARSGPVAIEKVALLRPDLVLMDIRLDGEMDGIEAARVLRDRYDTPVIFLTAFSDNETLERAKAVEPYGYILKPIAAEELRVVTEVAVHRHRAQRELKLRARQQAALAEFGRQALGGKPMDEVFAAAVECVAETLGAPVCVAFVVDREAASLERRAGRGWPSEQPRCPLSQLWPAQGGEELSAVRGWHRGDEHGQRLAELDLHHALLAPISDQGRLAGLLCVGAADERGFADQDAVFVQALAAMLAQVLQRDRINAERLEALEDLRQVQEALRAANLDLEQRVELRTRELRQKDEQLAHAQRMESIGRLAGGIAHDFNNLLFVIGGFASLVVDSLDRADPRHAQLAQVVKASDRAGALTRQLLAFGRKQVLKPEVLDLNEVVSGMDAMLRRLIRADIDIRTRLAPGLAAVRFDPGQIEQIVMNLAINASDAMPEGGKLTIETANIELDESYVAAHPEAQVGEHVMIAVTDTGTGMDAQTLARVFEPFFTTKRKGQGTGLGLAMVYGIVRQSGGTIWVYSEPGHGTTFKIYLPCTAEARPAATDAGEVPDPDAVGSETILVVEDEEGVRELLGVVLGAGGYEVLVAADAAEAIEIFDRRERDIDMLLSDVVLPDMGGPRLAGQLLARKPGLLVVYMSGYTDNAIVHHGVLDPGVAFVEKPIKPRQLLEQLRAYFREASRSPSDS